MKTAKILKIHQYYNKEYTAAAETVADNCGYSVCE